MSPFEKKKAQEIGSSPISSKTFPEYTENTGLSGQLHDHENQGHAFSTGDCLTMGQVNCLNGQIEETDLERLRKEHRELDEEIIKIESRPYISAADQMEIRRLKKIKLLKKDVIHALMKHQASA